MNCNQIYLKKQETQKTIENIDIDLKKIGQMNASRKNIPQAMEQLTGKIDRLSQEIIQGILPEASKKELMNTLKKKIDKARSFIAEKTSTPPFFFPFTSREKEWARFDQNLASSQQKIEEFLLYGQEIEHFVHSVTPPEQLAILWEKFVYRLFGFFREGLSRAIFFGYDAQQTLRESEKKLTHLRELEKTQSSQLNDHQTPSHRRLKLEAAHQQLSSEIASIEDKISQLQKNQQYGEKTRAHLRQIGGLSVKIEQKEACLDGMYLSCDRLVESFKKQGAKICEMQVSISQNPPFLLTGLMFPKTTNAAFVNETLPSLGLFSSDCEEESSELHKLSLMDGSFLLISDEDLEKLRDLNLIGFDLRNSDWFLQENSEARINLSTKEWDLSSKEERGTVLLTSGNVGVYEMHKKEILSFLMRGMNVMVFNFRGYGESTGVPTQEGLKRDMEAVYQYLKTHQKVEDEKLMVKALCMSGGLACHLAACHPNVNLFLDQSYADFQSLIRDKIKEELRSFIENDGPREPQTARVFTTFVESLLNPLIYFLVKCAMPSWSVVKEIGQIKGHVGLLMTKNDEFMRLDRDVAQNYAAAVKKGEAKSLSLFAMPGQHGASWLRSSSLEDIIAIASSSQADELIKKQGVLPPFPENYALSWDYNQEAALIRQLTIQESFSFQKQFESLLKEKKQLLFQAPEPPDQELQEPFFLSELKLQSRIEALLHDVQDTKQRELLAKAIDCLLIKKNQWARYRWQIEESEVQERMARILKKTPQEEKAVLKQFLEGKISRLKSQLEEGVDPEEAITLLIRQAPSERKETLRALLHKLVQPIHPFKQKYDEIVQRIEKNKKRGNALDLERWIQKEIQSLPLSFQERFATFIRQAIPIEAQLLTPKGFKQKVREGKIQMDLYLKKAGLLKSLIPA